MNNSARLIVVSNRLPITIESTENGKRLVSSSHGGLVSALIPILRETGGCWIGCTGTDSNDVPKQLFQEQNLDQEYSLMPVFLTASERASYYRGFSNEVIWPLFHGLSSRCQFDSAYWRGYCKVNGKFATAVANASKEEDFIWIHDYHLMILAQVLRNRGVRNHLAYFHHIPFPSPDIFEALPWRVEVLQALMRFNQLGFQTRRDRRNFVACLRRWLRGVRVCRTGNTMVAHAGGQSTHIGAYPISIDFKRFEDEASQPATTVNVRMIQTSFGARRIILGVDRLDYTKGILERLIAFRTLLDRNPELRGRVTMMQVVVPSREDIPEYTQLKRRIEVLISKTNGKYGSPGWVPIHYFYRSLSRTELIAFYRAASVALVTPLKDGMNLIAKEFCASRVDGCGVLVLSEFAGAAEGLRRWALLVNPHDAEGVAEALETALRMEESEQRARMENMRAHIRRNNVFQWARSFNVGTPYAPVEEDTTVVKQLRAFRKSAAILSRG